MIGALAVEVMATAVVRTVKGATSLDGLKDLAG
jgi:hypothetical protein